MKGILLFVGFFWALLFAIAGNLAARFPLDVDAVNAQVAAAVEVPASACSCADR